MATVDVAPATNGHSHDDTSAASSPSLSAARRDKVCDYYLLERGCVKGADCDFIHPKAPDGSATSKLCDFFYKPGRGCTKGDQCDHLHIPAQQLTGKYRELHPPGQSHGPPSAAFSSIAHKSVPCQFYLSAAGCKKGAQCDHLHAGFQQPASAPVSAFGVLAVGGRGICSFYLTPQGCRKAYQCDRDHIIPPGFPLTLPNPTAASAAYAAPVYAASQAYGLSRPPPPANSRSHPSRPVPCPYFTRGACKKGDDCEMIHQKQEVCQFMAKFGTATSAQHGSESACCSSRRVLTLAPAPVLSTGNCKKGEWCDYLVRVLTDARWSAAWSSCDACRQSTD